MNYKKLILIYFVFFLFGCVPQYKYELIKYKNSSTSSEQAKAICKPRAELEAIKAKNYAKDKIDREKNRVTGYNCNSNINTQTNSNINSYGYNYANISSRSNGYDSTNCTARTAGYGGGWAAGALAAMNSADIRNTYNNTKESVFNGCLAEYGYGVKKTCIKNCN
ncbi:MAG: hypothetical protein DSY43_06205 [Gammaproteobacteria bacterium]|uniref:Lipoprotein n=1 Tax=endosymbiont of Bathymodiolus septemdierum str. Myojin knoll TaxID=1303921 RepID=A0A0P0UR18_9GAMM|nr:hypothetical protein [Bathymodiolus septemdierum thioautotrophic gill symbiont]RUA04480.1 MAG: hypothetical protein DSY43_06205 [Gammaproteobacteria bacterium]BAS67468.1 hypothetical protein BSEPE_0458 [endosymbiont of Bathymodiolus septemdierum str. Myojin knoll]